MAAALVVVACAASGPSVPDRPAEIKATTAAGPAVKAEWETRWEKTLLVARQEGKVRVYSQAAGGLRADMTSAFKERYGIDLEMTAGRGEELVAKMEAERRAGLHTADVLFQGSGPALQFKAAGLLDPIEPALILRNEMEPKLWMGGGIYFVDKERKVISFLIHAGSTLIINSNLVRADEIKSYRDLLNPRWKGKMVMDNPTVSGAGSAFFRFSVMEIMGAEFARELIKQEPRILGDQRQLVEWIARGSYPIGLAPRPEIYQEFLRAGAPVKFVIPVEGTYSTGGGAGTVSLINGAPHPNAAAVFINWLLTRDGQTVIVKGAGEQSRRLDVTTEYIDDDRRIKPGIKYVDADLEEMIQKRLDGMKEARDMFAHLLK
ncbi:MAG: extracellular solute-binding protein [Chloroflexi bacterium]|nr:extracellular solute-binding protein [Chloroflexota bacterium]